MTVRLPPALRQLHTYAGHVTAAVLSLAVGMAVSLAVFSVALTVLFGDRPGIADPSRLLHVRWGTAMLPVSANEQAAIEAETASVFSGTAAEAPAVAPLQLTSGSVTRLVSIVSPHYFGTLGTRPIVGRLLRPEDDGASVAVISAPLWRERFDGAADLAGRTLVVAGVPTTVVGVTPDRMMGLALRDFATVADAPHVWLPANSPAARRVSSSGGLAMAGRLKSGVTFRAAGELINAIDTQLGASGSGARPSAARPLRAFRVGAAWQDSRAEGLMSLAVFLFVPLGILGIGCANVISLQLARSTDRTPEVNLRLALGASRGQVVRLLLGEAALLVVAAGLCGWSGAVVLLKAVRPYFLEPVVVDARVLLGLIGLVVATIAIAGLLPAWLATRRDALAMRDGRPAFGRVRALLLVTQLTASVTLLFITAMAGRTLVTNAPTLTTAVSGTVLLPVPLRELGFDEARAARFVSAAVGALADEPGVDAAGASDFLLADGGVSFRLSGVPNDDVRGAMGGGVTPGWLRAMGARPLAGRIFDLSDDAGSVVINEALAALLDPARSPIGQTISVIGPGGATTHEICGVVDTRALDLGGRAPLRIFLPLAQGSGKPLFLVAHGVDPERAAERLRAIVRRIEPAVPVDRVATLEARIRGASRGYVEMATAGASLSIVATVLSAVGLFAMVTYDVRCRTREIGVRIAVGARTVDILRFALRQAWWLTMCGLILGTIIGGLLSNVMRSVFPGLSPVDPGALAVSFVVMVIASLAATIGPAWRGARIDPVAALRCE